MPGDRLPSGGSFSSQPEPDRPSTTLDLSRPAHALELAVTAFAAELRQRLVGVCKHPHFQAIVYYPGHDGEPSVRYILADLSSPNRVTASTPEAALTEYVARVTDDTWKETRP
jgi:hypothetical protein